MKRTLAAFALVFGVMFAGLASAQTFCAQISGASIVASNGVFLGSITSEYDGDSIFNSFGTYGSEFSSESLYNSFSKYASKFSDLSVFNDYARNPPFLVLNNRAVARITTNKQVDGAINPYVLFSCR